VKPRSFVFSFGFREDLVLRRLGSLAIRGDEKIVLFTGSPIAQETIMAYNRLRDYCSEVGLKRPRLVELPTPDSTEAVIRVKHEVKGLTEPIITDLTDGKKSVSLAVFMGLLLSGKLFEVFISSEAPLGEELWIPPGITKAMLALSKEKRQILVVISRNKHCTVDLIAQKVGRAPKTIRNHLVDLKKMGLVVSLGKEGGLKLTSWGRVVLSAYK